MGKKKIIQKSESEVVKKTGVLTAAVKDKMTAVKTRHESGRIYIQASYNNTFITVTDKEGKVIAWLSAGSLGFSGPKKSTPFAASKVAEAIIEKIKKSGPNTVEIFVKGVGSGRDAALRSFAAGGLDIVSVKDVTPIPHNGPRPRKARRV